jgi:site-specific recombinase
VCCDAQYASGCWEWQVFWRPLHGAVAIYMINILVSSFAGLRQGGGTNGRLGR